MYEGDCHHQIFIRIGNDDRSDYIRELQHSRKGFVRELATMRVREPKVLNQVMSNLKSSSRMTPRTVRVLGATWDREAAYEVSNHR